MALALRILTHSEIGLVRKNNQDSGYASPHLLLVADGMGGAAAGDLASAVAVEAIREVDAPTPAEQMLPVLTAAIARANDRIASLVEADVALDGMGTTVTGALFDGAELGLAHLGDSRAYLFRDDRLERLTHDHSWVQSLVDEGRINEAEAAVHPHRSLLLKVLNGQPANDPDLTRVVLREGDRLLFCSDGLCGLVEDDAIADALRLPGLEPVMSRLVADAHAEGGIDNITVILADVVPSDGTAAGDTAESVVLGAAAELVTTPTEHPVGAAGPRPGPRRRGRSSGTGPGGATSLLARPSGGSTALLPGADLDPDEAGEDEARYRPQPPHRRPVLRPLVGLLVVLLVLGAAIGTAYAWGRTQYYVGTAGDQVAIYQGLPETVGVPLNRVYEVQALPVAGLPPFYADQVRTGIEVGGLDSARQTVAELREASLRCAGGHPTATPRPSTSPTGKGSPGAPTRPRATVAPATPSAPATAEPSC